MHTNKAFNDTKEYTETVAEASLCQHLHAIRIRFLFTDVATTVTVINEPRNTTVTRSAEVVNVLTSYIRNVTRQKKTEKNMTQ